MKKLKAEIQKEDSQIFPLKKYGIIFACMFLTTMLSLFQGTKTIDSIIGLTKCSNSFWVLSLVYQIVILALGYYGSKIISEEQKKKEKSGYTIQEFQNWTFQKIAIVNVGGFFQGSIAAMLGLGGGFFYIPIQLYFGNNPEVVNATALFVVFWAKLMSTIVIILSGDMFIQTWFVNGFLIFQAGYWASKKITLMIRKLNRASYLSFGFCALNLTALVTTSSVIASSVISKANKGENIWLYGNYCSN